MRARKEIWKEYPLNFEFEGNYKIEVSNFGNAKTYNTFHPEGKIINETLQGGFPVIRAKLFKERSAEDVKKIETLQAKIDALSAEIKKLGFTNEEQEQKVPLRAERDKLIQKRKKLNYNINKKRSYNLMLLKHRAVAELFLDPPKNGDEKFIIHKDFDKTNNHVDNLAWASQDTITARFHQHPIIVMKNFKKQFMPNKVDVKTSKLTETEVLVIKKRLKRGYTLSRLSKQFGVSDMQIHRIKTGENWSHVKLIEDILEEKKK